MPKISKPAVDTALRNQIFDDILSPKDGWNSDEYIKVNDRQYGVILHDLNGTERYCRIGIIVAEEREDMTARELMQKEIDEYNAKQAKKAEQQAAAKEKAERDKAERLRKAAEKKGE